MTGSAGGLGRSIAKVLAARGMYSSVCSLGCPVLTKQLGAHITLFSRRSDPLDKAREEVTLACASKDQDVNTVMVDMGDDQEVWAFFIQSPN